MTDLKFHQNLSLFLSRLLYLLPLASMPQETDRPTFQYGSLQNLYFLAVQNPLFSLLRIQMYKHIGHLQV